MRKLVRNRLFIGISFVLLAVVIAGIIAAANAQSVQIKLETNAGVIGYTADGVVHVIIDIEVINDGWESKDAVPVSVSCIPSTDTCAREIVVELEDGFTGRTSEYIRAPMGASLRVGHSNNEPYAIGIVPKRLLDVNREAWDCYKGANWELRDNVRCGRWLEPSMTTTNAAITEIIEHDLVQNWMTLQDIGRIPSVPRPND